MSLHFINLFISVLLAAALFVVDSPAEAQSLAVPAGWRPRPQTSPVIKFDCASKVCGENSIVSLRSYSGTSLPTTAILRNTVDGANKQQVTKSGGLIFEATVVDAFATNTPKYRAITTVTRLQFKDGKTAWNVSSLTTNGTLYFQIEAIGADQAIVRKNATTFLPIPFISVYLSNPSAAPR